MMHTCIVIDFKGSSIMENQTKHTRRLSLRQYLPHLIFNANIFFCTWSSWGVKAAQKQYIKQARCLMRHTNLTILFSVPPINNNIIHQYKNTQLIEIMLVTKKERKSFVEVSYLIESVFFCVVLRCMYQ